MNTYTHNSDKMKIHSAESVNSLVGELNKSPRDINNIKKIILNYSFKLMDNNIIDDDLYSCMNEVFSCMEKKWLNVLSIYKNVNTKSAIRNFEVNYHLYKLKTSDEKIKKDFHYSKVHGILNKLVIKIVRKENMWEYDEDLYSAGFIWVLKAIQSDFDPIKADFSTYAYMKIRKEIQDSKSLSNSMHYIPHIHNYYFNSYRKIFKDINKHDDYCFDEIIIEKAYKKLSKNNLWVTKRLLSDIVNNKLSCHVSLDKKLNLNWNTDSISVIDTIETEVWVNEMNQVIDNSILRDQLKNFLSKYTDFERSIIERKFWINLWWENSYPVYTIKVIKNWVHSKKEMIAIKSIDAIVRVKSLWYEVLSTREEVDKTLKTETYVGSSMKKLREYFEIKKLTHTSEMALRKNEKKIISQLRKHLKDVYKSKWIDEPSITFNT